MAKCGIHGRKIQFVCLKKDCQRSCPSMCQTCLTTIHSHPQYSSLRIQGLSDLLDGKERPGDTLASRKKLRAEFSQFLGEMKQVFNQRCARLQEIVEEYLKNLECYNGNSYSAQLFQTIMAVRTRNYKELSTDSIRKLCLPLVGMTALTSQNQTDLTRHYKGFLEHFQSNISSFQDSFRRLFKSQIFSLFDMSFNNEPFPSFQKINQSINLELKGSSGADKNAQSMRLTKKALKAQQVGNYEQAMQLYRLAIDIQPKNSAAHNNLGVLLKNTGDIQQALKQFSEAALANPSWTMPFINRGNCLRSLGKYQQSLQYYQDALWLDPACTSAWYNRAIALQMMGRYPQAIKAIDQIKRHKEPTQDTLLLEGLCYSSVARFQKAIQLYDRVLLINPRSDDALFNKSIALQRQNRRAEAFVVMKMACEIRPDDKQYKIRLQSLR